jgi:hypothetical protein
MLRSLVVEYATKHLSVGPTERLFARRPRDLMWRLQASDPSRDGQTMARFGMTLPLTFVRGSVRILATSPL